MDQTNFSYNQPILETTPKPIPPVVQEPQLPAKKSGKPIIVIGSVVATTIIILVAIVLTTLSDRNNNHNGLGNAKPVSTPSPTQNPLTREFRSKLDTLETQIDQSDPSVIELKPPPLDYKLELR